MDQLALEKIYRAKELQRTGLARLPFQEKIRILVTIQKRADGIIRSRGGAGRVIWKLLRERAKITWHFFRALTEGVKELEES